MKIIQEYSHLGGSEILNKNYPEIEKEIYNIIKKVDAPRNKIIGGTGRNSGKLFYTGADFNKSFEEAFKKKGYKSKIRTNFEIPLHDGRKVKSHKEIDFQKGRVFVEVQFGKYFAMFNDLAKFQYFFSENKADIGVEIIPCYDLMRQMPSGVPYGEVLIDFLNRLRNYPSVPLKVILLDSASREYPFTQIDL